MGVGGWGVGGGSPCWGGFSQLGGVGLPVEGGREVSLLGGLLVGGVFSMPGGLPARGVSLPGGALLPRGLLTGGASLGGGGGRGFSLPETPLWTESQTRVKNIILATTLLRPVINIIVVFCNQDFDIGLYSNTETELYFEEGYNDDTVPISVRNGLGNLFLRSPLTSSINS